MGEWEKKEKQRTNKRGLGREERMDLRKRALLANIGDRENCRELEES